MFQFVTTYMDNIEENPKEYNLDKNGDYINCINCESKLKAIEKWDDTCLSCKIEMEE